MLPLKLTPAFERNVFELSWSLDRKQSLVDLDDVTTVAASVLSNPEAHLSATYELVGAGRYTAHDLGETISRVMEQPVAVREIDADEYALAWLGNREPADAPHQLSVLRSISSRYSAHDFLGNPNVLTWLLGRSPTTFDQFVQREWDAYRKAQR
jgi:uncharacterized protein YbjT (DUF2867 family)